MKTMSHKSGVSIIIENLIGFYTLKPVIDRLVQSKMEKLYLYSYDASILSYCASNPKVEILPLSLLDTPKLKKRNSIFRAILFLLTPKDYSIWYLRKIYFEYSKDKGIKGKLFKLKQLLKGWGLKKNRVNATITLLFKFYPLAGVFPTKKIVTLTSNRYSHLLCPNNSRLYCLMESWDQISKYPLGYKPYKTYLWNSSIGKLWASFQDASPKSVNIIYPAKIKYAIDAWSEVKLSDKITRVLFPMTFSSNSKGTVYESELFCVKALAKVLEANGIELYIKPKPTTPSGELDHLKEYAANVIIGHYKNSVDDDPSNYYLDETYNENRIKEVQTADLVVNIGTTFSIESAILGVPVLQLKFNPNSDLGVMQSFEHLKIFLNEEDEVLYIDNQEELELKISQWFSNKDDRHLKQTQRIRNWIKPEVQYLQALTNVVEDILK